MNISHLPETPGVYLMRDASGAIIYIGKARNLKKRAADYFTGSGTAGSPRKANLAALVRKIDYIPASSEREALVAERELIRRCQPFFNVMWKDSKTYPYVKITREDFPRVFLTRKKEDDGARYFGPYPRVDFVRKLLARFWKTGLINLRQCRWDFCASRPLSRKRINACLYYHTERCPAPCAGRISKSAYGILVRRTKDLLSGRYGKLMKNFETGMKKASSDRRYEEAAVYRDFMNAVKHMGEKVLVERFDADFIAEGVKRVEALTEIRNILKLKNPPGHIETFDTSSLFARHCTASSVCFINGERNTSHYRRYRIRFKSVRAGSNDLEMMREAVQRRLTQIKKSGEPLPDLLVIDGGPSQLFYAMAAIKSCNLQVPVIALAKRFEEIYMPGRSSTVTLPPENPGRRLLEEMRDEAHRFAIHYHRKLRDKLQ
ncbi:MAG: GIY-YIG nuclease family protein [Elusimicrobia bacterium]|nr:GIY-YIG nuclease family protein [Elusimicrobiota bacterium]